MCSLIKLSLGTFVLLCILILLSSIVPKVQHESSRVGDGVVVVVGWWVELLLLCVLQIQSKINI